MIAPRSTGLAVQSPAPVPSQGANVSMSVGALAVKVLPAKQLPTVAGSAVRMATPMSA